MAGNGPTARTPSAKQLSEWTKKNKGKNSNTTTTSDGNPLFYKDATLTVGSHGPIVLYDWFFLDEMSHFNRERVPERVVHAKGAGAFGYFEVTHDITQYTVAKVFSSIGKKTPVACRFSQVAGNMGSQDTVRDPRGFALKFYTEDGIWDLTGNNTPIFFVRDPILFVHFIHSQKRNPVTNMRDWDAYWDFFSQRPESVHQFMFLYSDRGIPDGHRHQHGYGSHSFSLINKDGNLTFCKFHYRTDQGIKNLDPQKAEEIGGVDPDYAVRDLYDAIASKNFPSWSFYIQVMTPNQAKASKFNPFDITKIWPKKQYPLIPVGKLVLNRNPENYFAEVEQIAFNPANMPVGIGPSPDRFLQGRLFAYGDAHRYRLGVNNAQIPVNCPFKVRNYERDGAHTINNQGGAPNYHPNTFAGPKVDPDLLKYWPTFEASGEINWYDLGKEDNFSQPRSFYEDVLSDDKRTRLVNNIVDGLRRASKKIQENATAVFAQVSTDLGNRIAQGLQTKKATI